MGFASAAHDLQGSSERFKTRQLDERSRPGDPGRCWGEDEMERSHSGAAIRGASARYLPDGERPQDLGDQYRSSHARCEESVLVRWKQFRNLRARTADDDDSGV